MPKGNSIDKNRPYVNGSRQSVPFTMWVLNNLPADDKFILEKRIDAICEEYRTHFNLKDVGNRDLIKKYERNFIKEVEREIGAVCNLTVYLL